MHDPLVSGVQTLLIAIHIIPSLFFCATGKRGYVGSCVILSGLLIFHTGYGKHSQRISPVNAKAGMGVFSPIPCLIYS